MTERLKYTTLNHWHDQALTDSLAWHQSNGCNNERELTVYSAGFRQGWNAAIADLKRHNYIKPLDYLES
jgi:hypothetical protein